MTSQKDQIQALITDIDGVLQKTTPRLPWVVSGEVTQQRQVLERVRNYLVTYQRQQSVNESYGQGGARPDLLAHDIYYQPTQQSYQAPAGESQADRSHAYRQDELSAQQMLQAIVQDMGYLRANVMQPLQSDLELLRQQRESLVQEIRQLEAQRQGYAGQIPGNQQQMIAEFLQALMSRLQETLPQQVAQTLRGSNQQSLPYSGDLALSGSATQIQRTSNSATQGLGNIQVPQTESDELLLKLDSTLSVVFESLQRNVQAYEESLSKGLDKMHSMGQQGEMMFTALISHLANQLGHEASAYLQPPVAKGLESTRLASSGGGTTAEAAPSAQRSLGVVNASLFEQPNAGLEQSNLEQSNAEAASQSLQLPFPGTEISSNVAGMAAASNRGASVDTAIDSWLRSASGVEATPAVDYELAELNLEGFDLNQLDAQDVNALLELDANLLNTNLPPQPLLEPIGSTDGSPQAASGLMPEVMSVEDTADIDAALKLLEQLSAELQEQPASMADADARIDRMLSTPSSPSGEATTATIPDDARDELDEFYESLFGHDAIAAGSSLVSPAATDALVDVAPAAGAVDHASARPGTEPAPAMALLTTQTTLAQPVETLPAEAQAPVGALAAPELATPPAISATVDPTLGWDLLAKKPVNQVAAEPEIPAALLDDELLNGWDFEETELASFEPATEAAGSELLGVEDPSTAVDHESLPVAMPASPTETVETGSTELPGSPDEISTLDDLFDDLTPGGGSEAPIASPVEAPERLAQPRVSATEFTAFVPASQPPAAPVEDRLGDDRYMPASPEEDLLLLDEPAAADSELWLDEGTLNRLSEDLFNLEEAIAEPSPLLAEAEFETDASLLYFDETAAVNETTTLDETAASQGIPQQADELLSIDDWSDSLNELDAEAGAQTDAVLPFIGAEATEVEVSGFGAAEPVVTDFGMAEFGDSAIAAEPTGAFILEGMDDLFANTPLSPPVTPVPPPVASAQTDAPNAFTLEGMDDLFADAPIGSSPLPQPSFPAMEQSPPFTLDGIDDLFNDVPMVSATPLPSATALPSDESLPFTLEGVDELFADAPPVGGVFPVEALPASSDTVTTAWSAMPDAADFTLETDDVFVPAPTAGSLPMESMTDGAIAFPSATLADQPAESVAPFTFESVAPFTFEQVGDLFMEVPSGEQSSQEQVTNEPSIAMVSLPEETAEPVAEPVLAPFTLEQVGDFFREVPSAADRTDPPTTPPQASSSESEPSTLEQAFASLLGSFDEPFGEPMSDADAHDPEKKN